MPLHTSDFSSTHHFGVKASKWTKVLLFDLDGVIVDLENWFYDRWSDLYPDEPLRPREERTKFYLSEDNPPEYKERLEALLCQEGAFSEPKPMPGAIEAIKEIAQFGEVFFCTAPMFSNPTCMPDKVAWIEKHFGDETWTHRIIIAKDKTAAYGHYLFDDRAEVEGRLHPMWEHVVFDNPTNRHIRTARRVLDWEDAVRFVKQECNGHQ